MTYQLAPVHRDDASAEFFDATAEGRLLLRRCLSCGHVRGPEVPTCGRCVSEDTEWIASSGKGTLMSWVVMPGRKGPDGSVGPSSIVATVELEEGPWFVSALIDADPGALRGSMPIVVAFVRPEDSEAIPVFRVG